MRPIVGSESSGDHDLVDRLLARVLLPEASQQERTRARLCRGGCGRG